MIIRVIYRRKTYLIYGTLEALSEANITLHDNIATAQIGDYLASNNGYYVPVVNRHDVKRVFKHSIRYAILLQFPGRKSIAFYPEKPIGFQYDPYLVDLPNNKIKLKEKAIIYMLERGLTFFEAVSFAYNQPLNMVKLQLLNLINNQHFYHIAKEYIAMNLKDNLDDLGITKEYLAAKLKDILDDKTENPALRKQALISLQDMVAKSLQHNNNPNSHTYTLIPNKPIQQLPPPMLD